MPAGKDGDSSRRGSTTKKNAFCSFCRKSYKDVGPLVEGPGDVYICGECIDLCHNILDQEQRRMHYITIKSEYAKSKFNLAFCEIENEIFCQLPENIRLGYKLAKAMRNRHIIQDILPKLQTLGVFHDLEDLISSYMLKTMVLFITKRKGPYECFGDYIYFTRLIYTLLREFLQHNKEIPHFFLIPTPGIEFKRTLFACNRSLFQPQCYCCRKREAIILVCNEILKTMNIFENFTAKQEEERGGELEGEQLGMNQSDSLDAPMPSCSVEMTSPNEATIDMSALDNTDLHEDTVQERNIEGDDTCVKNMEDCDTKL